MIRCFENPLVAGALLLGALVYASISYPAGAELDAQEEQLQEARINAAREAFEACQDVDAATDIEGPPLRSEPGWDGVAVNPRART